VGARIIIVAVVVVKGTYKTDANKKRPQHTKPLSIQSGRIRKATKTLVQVRKPETRQAM